MSRFLRFLKVFVVATICTFSALSAYASGSTNLRYTLNDHGAKVASVPSAFDIGAYQQLTSTPYKPGYGYAGHWTQEQNPTTGACRGQQVIDHNGVVQQSLNASTTLHACWVLLKLARPGTDLRIFVLDANGGNSVGNIWHGYTPISFSTNYNNFLGGFDQNIKYENRGDWAYLSRNTYGTTLWYTPLNSSLYGLNSDGTLNPRPEPGAGQVFDGYYANANGTGGQFFNAAGVSENLRDLWSSNLPDYNTIYARWATAVYRVNFVAGGSTGSEPTEVYLRYGDAWYDTEAHAQAGGETGRITGLTTLPTYGNMDFVGYYTGTGGNGTQITDRYGAFADATTLTAITNNTYVYPYFVTSAATWVEITLNNNNGIGERGDETSNEEASGSGGRGTNSSSSNKLYYPLSGCATSGYRRSRDCNADIVTSVHVPQYTGHVFYGYYDSGVLRINSTGSITYVPSAGSATSQTWTAQWSDETFTVSYAPGSGGSGTAPVSPTSCTYGSGNCYAPANTYNPPSGQVFAGWSCVVNGTNPGTGAQTTVPCAQNLYLPGNAPANDLSYAINVPNINNVTGITLTATWVADSVTYYGIRLRPNGGTTSGQAVIYEVYNVGWFRAQNSNAQITTNPPNIFVAANLGGGGLTAPTHPNGYQFGGYCTVDNNCTDQYKVIDADGNILKAPTFFDRDRPLYAHWIEDVDDVRLIVNCGYGDVQNCTWNCNLVCPEVIQAVPGNAFPALNCVPTKEESVFVGFFDAETGGNEYYHYDGVSLNATNYNNGVWPASNAPDKLYAHWQRVSYDVNYYCSQSAYELSNIAFADQAYKICPTYVTQVGGTADLCPNQATTTSTLGNKFDHWQLAEDSGVSYAAGRGYSWPYGTEKNLVAVYKPIYLVNLNHGGADNNPAPSVVYFSDGEWYSDALATVPLASMSVPPTKTGYQFQGYKLSGNNNLTVVDAAGRFQTSGSITNAINANGLTITADWTLQTFVAEFDQQFENGATGTSNGTEKIYYNTEYGWTASNGSSQTITSIQIPQWPGHIFSGYYIESGGSGTQVIDGTGQIMVTGSDALALFQSGNSRQLFASWTTQTIPTDPDDYFAVTTTNLPANTTFAFGLAAAGDFYVQWDATDTSTVEHIVRLQPSVVQSYSHTYSASGPKTIKIWGTATEYYGYGSGYPFAAITFGSYSGSTASYVHTPELVAGISGSLGAVFPTIGGGSLDSQNPQFAGTFSGCNNLTGNIPTNLFNGVTKPGQFMFQGTFRNCTGLTSIPGGLFDSVVGEPKFQLFAGTFEGCTGIGGQIPTGLFDSINGVVQGGMFIDTFKNTGITAIPPGLFNNLSGVANSAFASTFQGCSALTSIPADLFSTISATGNVTGNAGYLFAATFSGSGITSLPATLFGRIDASGVDKTAMMSSMFAGAPLNASGQNYIPRTLFLDSGNQLILNDTNPDSYWMSGIFSGTGLVTNCENVGLTDYPTPAEYEDFWEGKKICAPAATFSCGMGTGTAPDPIFVDPVTSGSVSFTFPAGTGCFAPSHYHYNAGNTDHRMWTCDGSACNSGGTQASWSGNLNYPGQSSMSWDGQQSVEFYVTYLPNEYSVTLSANGGSFGSNGVQTLWEQYNTGWDTNQYGSYNVQGLTSAQLPTRANWNFLGYWDTDAATGGNLMIAPPADSNSSAAIVAPANTLTSNGSTWYARWSQSNGPFTATYSCGDHGTWADAQTSNEQTVNYNQTVSPAIFAASVCTADTGYVFNKWQVVGSGDLVNAGANNYTWPLHSGSSIVAQWTPIQTTITLNPNLPTIASGEHAGEIDGSLVNATLSGFGQTAIYTRYDDGVYRSNAGGVLSEQMLSNQNPLNPSDRPAKRVNVTFNTNGGQITVDGTTYPNNNDPFKVVLDLPFQGYFLGGVNTPYIGTNRYLTAQGHNHGIQNVSDNETWVAHWQNINLTNGYFQDQSLSFNSLIPTRSDGYVFDGWYTAATGGHRIMQTGTGQIVEVIDLDTHEQVVVSQNIEWYAHWTPCAATANADAHAVRTGATSENGQCVYNLVCELCPDNAQDCYSQLGGTDTTYSFNFTTAQTSGTLPLSSGDQVASCSARSYNINYVIGDNATLPSSGTPMTYTYGEGATINGVPTKPNEEFQGWCTSDSAQTCPMTQTLGSEAHGHKIFWALWDCAFGYRKYAYDTITTVYDGNGGYAGGFFAAGTCAPIRYRVMCDKNCPSGETCNACLEDFNFGAANTVNKYSLGFAYNGITINQSNCDMMYAGDPLPAPVYHVEQDPQLYINNFTQTPDPKYAELACWIYDSEHFTNIFGNYTNGNYVTFMQTLAGETYNQSINFGATHYDFDGLWTADGSQQNGDGIQYVNSSGWVGQGNQAITSEYASKFFVQDTPVYAHWKPKVYTITLDKQDGNGGLSHIYEKYNTGWSSQVPSSSNPNVTYQPADQFTFSSSQIPSKTGYNFGGYRTAESCGGILIVNADGTMNVNANNGSGGSVANAKIFGAATTLYACWNPQSFEITLDNANATTNGTATIYTKYGVGVYKDAGFNYMMTSGPNGQYPITVPQRSYTVTYDLNYTGKPNAHPADGTSNYPFSGYYVSNNQYIEAGGKITTAGMSAGQGYLSNQTWNARWGSGTAVTLPSVYDSVSTYNGRPGYIFTGWFTGSGTSRGYAGATYVPTASETLYAHWDECNYSAGPNSTVALKSDENPNPNNSNQCVYTVTCTDDYLGPGNTHSFTAYGTANVATGTLPGCDVNGAYPITYDYQGGSGVFAYPDYIPFNGSQYIDTGINIKKGYTITAQFEPTQSGTYLYGARGTNVPNASAYISNNANWRWGDDGIMVSGVSVSTGSVHTSVQNDSGVQIDNGAVQSYTGGTLSNFETPVTLAIGANHTGASTYASAERFVGNLYSFQIRDNNNNLVYDGVPVQNMVTLEYGLCNDVTKECVTFDASGATTPTALPTRHVYGTATTVSGYAMRANHVFAGWCDSQDSSHCSVWPASYVIGTEEQGPVTLEAQWSCNPGYTLVNNSCVANTINITYANGGHGTAPQSQSCTYGESNLTFPGAIVVDDGYEFNKWRVGESGPEYYDFDPFVCNEQYLGVTSGSVTVTATWNPKVYDITYNYNGGSRSLLPTGYTQLDYIESDNGQYINTGIKYGTSESVKYNIDFKVNTFTQAGLWGALNNKRTGTIWLNSNAFKVSMGGTQSSNSTIAIPFDTDRHVAVFSAGLTSSNANVNLLFDNHSYTMPYTYNETYMGKDQDIMLFYGYGGLYQPAQMRVYNFQIYLDDKLVFNGIPAQHGTDVGLYDTVSGEFFTSVPNNTNFVAGTPTATAAGYPEHYTHGVGATVYGVPTRANSVFQGWCRTYDEQNDYYAGCAMPHEIAAGEHADVPLWAKWSCDPGYELNGTGDGQQCTPRAYSMNYTCSDGAFDYTYKGTPPTAQTAYYSAMAPVGATLPAIGNCKKVYGEEGASDYCEDCFNFLGWRVKAENQALLPGPVHAASQRIPTWGETNNTTWCRISNQSVNDDWGSTSGNCAAFVDDNPFTLYPAYAPKEYPITYMYATTPGANGSLPSTHTYTQPTSISGEGMQLANARFTGWCKNSPNQNCTSGEYYYQTSVGAYEHGPVTYYAQWECNEGYELSYDENDNPVCNQATFDIHYVYDVEHDGALMSGYVYPSQYTHGTATTIPAGATRPNSVFQSWCTNLSDANTCQTPTNDYAYEIDASTYGPVTLYAKWSCEPGYTLGGDDNNSCNPNTITIIYANGGHGGDYPPDPVTCTYGTNTEPWADALFETGYVFGGWSINSGLQAAGTPIVCDHTTLGVYSGSVTATASWSAQGWPVRYSCGNAAWGDAPLDGNAVYLDPFSVAQNTCERPGYAFDKWLLVEENVLKDQNTSFNWTYTDPDPVTNDFHFVAQWTFNPVFTVTTVPMSASEADAAKRTISFDLAAKGTFYVDWDGEGDAAPQEIISTTTNTTRYTHTYVASEFGGESTKSFVIQFAGRATEYYSGASSFYTRPGIKFFNGTLDGSTVTVDGTEVNIAGISGCLGCIFPTLGTTGNTQQTQTRFYQTFRNAKNMAGSIPANLFGDVAGQTIPYMFSQTFWGCEKLTGQIPAGLFGNVTGAPKTSIFGHTFNGCKGLSGQIPAGLFANISGAPAQYMFYYMFNGCENLTGIPAGLFSGISGAPSDAMFTRTFANCTNLTGSIPAGLFGGISGAPAINMYNSTFINCKKLSGAIPAGLFGDISGDAKKSMFNGTFYGCEELTGQIPGTLFKGNGTGISGVPAESMFASTFASCKKLTGPIPLRLFGVPSGAPQKNMFYYTFSGTTLLSGAIPDRLFGDISGAPAEAMFYATFQNSGVSGQIPANLFKGNGTGISGAPQKNMFRSTFYNCPNLTGEIPSSLFGAINGTAAEGMFRYTFRGCSGLTGTIPSTLFGTLSGSAADMFAYTFYGDTHLTGYVPAGLFSNITVPTSLETAPTDMMTDIFYNTGLATECPCGTLPVETGLRDLYWRENNATIPPRAISCAVDTSGAFYWYDGQCSEVCPATSIDELHVGSGLTYVTLKDKIKTPSINVRYTDPTVGDTTCYVPMVAGDGGTNSLNMLYAGNVHHAVMATTTPPADFGQR